MTCFNPSHFEIPNKPKPMTHAEFWAELIKIFMEDISPLSIDIDDLLQS